MVPAHVVKAPEDAAKQAAELAGPVALKILSRDISHKSDVGGVALDLQTPGAVRAAAEAMLLHVTTKKPEARVDGFMVQPMVRRPDGFELIVGVIDDQQFGPVILFGHGGTAVEVVEDTALALPPLNMHLAREVMSRTRVSQLLQGFGATPAAALDDIALTLIKVSQLIVDIGQVSELEINPLLAGEFGVIALDTRLRVRATDQPATSRLAIRPYPKELEEIINVPDGRRFLLRPVRPEDEPEVRRLFAQMSPEDIRMRFFVPQECLSHTTAARMTQIDYDREMALVLAEPGAPGQSEIFGGVRIAADPDGERAEYAISVRSDMGGHGLGPLLLQRIIDYARGRGIREIFGEVLRENKRMLKVCDQFAFSRTTNPDDPSVIDVRLTL